MANLKSISHRCHPILVAFVWELTKETIDCPLSCLQGGLRERRKKVDRPVAAMPVHNFAQSAEHLPRPWMVTKHLGPLPIERTLSFAGASSPTIDASAVTTHWRQES